jgi:hypothetical protein
LRVLTVLDLAAYLGLLATVLRYFRPPTAFDLLLYLRSPTDPYLLTYFRLLADRYLLLWLRCLLLYVRLLADLIWCRISVCSPT